MNMRLLSGIFLFSIFILFSACDNRASSAYRHLKQFTGQDLGLKVIVIDEGWSNGVEAIGIVEKSTERGPMTNYYYLDNQDFIWHEFYRRKIHIPK